ncbi:MAG TPA: DUF2752 domain-containing protein [Fimbriiglobus sp.]|jgi:hypothetical protein
MPTPEHELDDTDEIPVVGPAPGWRREARVSWLTRLALVGMAGAFVAVFTTAALLHPYRSDGTPRTMATHTQLGLPQCNFVTWTGKPCPSCGMTTSFAHLVHGNVWSSLKANWTGTLLALYWFALIPWGLVSAVRGRLYRVKNGEAMITASIGIFTVLMLLRWVVVIAT